MFHTNAKNNTIAVIVHVHVHNFSHVAYRRAVSLILPPMTTMMVSSFVKATAAKMLALALNSG